MTKQIYLEGKALELVALQLTQWGEDEQKSAQSSILRPDDIKRLHHAKDILTRNWDNPPSLLDLARLAPRDLQW